MPRTPRFESEKIETTAKRIYIVHTKPNIKNMASANPGLIYRVNGMLDMRRKENKEWLRKEHERNMLNLREQCNEANAKAEHLEARVSRQNKTIQKLSGGKEAELDPEECDCAICMEPMQGRVTLRCGHEICPNCFAQHARQNNTCPFCREEFSCKPKKPREKMPDSVADAIVDHWSTIVREDYFAAHCEVYKNKRSADEKEAHLRRLVVENAKIIIKHGVRNWYENTSNL